VKTLLLALSVIKESEKGSELVRNRGGAEVVLQDLKHFKALPIVLSVGILEEVAYGAILESRAKLALPELAGERVVRVSVTRRESSRAVEKPGDRSQKRMRSRNFR